jgi:hypothetical protein
MTSGMLAPDLRRRLRIAQDEVHRPAVDAARTIDRDLERAIRLVIVLAEKRGAAGIGTDHVDRVRLGRPGAGRHASNAHCQSSHGNGP